MSQEKLRFIQLALCSSDLPASLRFYAEVFGFANGGGQGLWGEIMRVQGLSPEARAMMWWMVGRQAFCQLEFFHHTQPVQRPLPSDWRPCDIGWTRFGLSVTDFERTLERLKDWGVALLAEPRETARGPRAAFRDPWVGAVVEVMGETAALPGGIRERHFELEPAIIYVASSVSDLDAARFFYGTQLRLELVPLEVLHDPDDEAIWGLEGARRDGFVARAGDAFLEVLQYLQPAGRPAAADRCNADQGIMNIALGSRNNQAVRDVIARLDAEGRGPRVQFAGEGMLGTYVLDAEREVELFSGPAENDAALGFAPAGDFIGVPRADRSALTLSFRE
jgi:catechol 2,3-dioxygenase-like lactoylglutathione lyase family enzyme